MFKGSVVQLSAKGALVNSHNGGGDQVPSGLSNIKLNLLNSATASEDIYAKVLSKPAKPGMFYIRFTSLPPEVAAMLADLYKAIAN